jgi:CRP-like cAMP-binding protein
MEALREQLTRDASLDIEAKVELLRSLASELEEHGRRRARGRGPIWIVPYRPGARAIDEGYREGTGSSEFGGLLDSTRALPDPDEVILLYELDFGHPTLAPLAPESVEVELELAFVTSEGDRRPVPGLVPRRIEAARIDSQPLPGVAVTPARFERRPGARYVASFVPQHDLLPVERGGRHWSWRDAPPVLARYDAAASDPFTLAHRFLQHVRADLVLRHHGEELGRDSIGLEIFDLGRFGSLYDRLIDRLLPADLERQQAQLALENLALSHHPWFPVLMIGREKARLYVGEIRVALELQHRSPVDARWLLHVGLYLELLTCLGIAEAVSETHPDLLTSAEREAIARAPGFEPIRSRLNPSGWRDVWKLREIIAPRSELTRTGAVDLSNLRRKQEATLAFLHVHHEDLKRAIELAGPNPRNSQETWHRVFRDAERAVLTTAIGVFPELLGLPERARQLALWSQIRGRVLGSLGPRWMVDLLGQLDGIYPSASRKYRASMNEVAEWARERELMDYTGDECISERASLIEASLQGAHAHVAALNRRDGTRSTLGANEIDVDDTGALDLDRLMDVLRGLPLFQSLTEKERRQVARGTRVVGFGPDERVVVQGQPGESLFIIAKGKAEVLVRDGDRRDRLVDDMGVGAVFGEAALLTGASRNATVRAETSLSLFEIHRSALAPVLQARPSLAVDLGILCAQRLARRGTDAERNAKETSARFTRRIRAFLLG